LPCSQKHFTGHCRQRRAGPRPNATFSVFAVTCTFHLHTHLQLHRELFCHYHCSNTASLGIFLSCHERGRWCSYLTQHCTTRASERLLFIHFVHVINLWLLSFMVEKLRRPACFSSYRSVWLLYWRRRRRKGKINGRVEKKNRKQGRKYENKY
jgi:hypothetical protein